ncbi:c-type cytochrome [Fulvivirga sediminis]|uniref:Cytochrome c n=1 Tax=Fulvivirga sediminis TaxID=2803949 RepID=A0A937F7C7_9BACT|nr:cytochrome c [Fulvivirga sediminis]MBL3655438.1 cytochrome c [Fulvivirga sediminis]
MNIYRNIKIVFGIALAASLASCAAGGEDQGLEYAPNMYHSVPYEPLTQITDESAGTAAEWLDENSDGHGEYYNSNPLNPHGMTMRIPPANTVKRNKNGFLPYRLPKDSLTLASRTLKNPLPNTDEVIEDGHMLYNRFCEHCHGGAGQADGLVSEKFPGVANLTGAAYKDITEGHIFHVITWGKGLMGAHGSQLSPEERWKIAKFVKTLQK